MRADELPEYAEVVARSRIETDISDHLPTLFLKSLEMKPRLIVELGVRGGESTFVLERVARLSEATLVSVDIENCATACAWDRWHFLQGDDVELAHSFASWCYARGIEPKIDVLFVDTSHELEHTRQELQSWLPFLAPHGRAFFHDTNLKSVIRRKDGRKQPAWDNARGVTRALEEYLGCTLDERRDFELVHGDWRVEHQAHTHGFTMLERGAIPEDARSKIAVFCERIDNESFCESVVRELRTYYDVRAYGPGWEKKELTDLDREDLAFHLELDPASGNFFRPPQLDLVQAPKFAWLIDTHKKPDFHRTISSEMDLTFYAMKNWGHVLRGRASWLPLHCDSGIFYRQEREREYDIVFVGSHGWRAEPILRIARKHGLRAHVECTTGDREKTATAEIYARAKLVYNRHITNDLNFRVFEAMACGRVLLTDAQANGQYELFEDGRHCIFYKDERDLEALVLDALADSAKRTRMEREAARAIRAHHSTRARVAQLRQAIEAYRRPEAREIDDAAQETVRTSSKKKWLIVAGSSYGERLARTLEARGHEVTVARERVGTLPRRECSSMIDLPPMSLVRTPTTTQEAIASATPHHGELTRLVKRQAFDGILAEGAWAALASAPAAERAGIPFLFALGRVEVERRSNRLDREQLYVAELEQWSVDRACAVVVPGRDVARDVEQYYSLPDAICLAGEDDRAPHEGGERLASALGLETPYVLVLGDALSAREKRAVLAGSPHPTLLACDDVMVGQRGRGSRHLKSTPLTGVVLRSLAAAAEVVVALSPKDERLAEVAGHARRVVCLSRDDAVRGDDWSERLALLEHAGVARDSRSIEDLERAIEVEHAVL